MARLCGRAFTVFAGVFDIKIEFYFCTKYGVFEFNINAGFHIVAARLAPTLATRIATTKEVVKDITKAHIAKIKMHTLALPTKTTKRIAATAIAANAGMAKLVVALSF